jgi:hypothetical protein
MKKFLFLATASLFIVGMTSCKKDLTCSCTYTDTSLNTATTCEGCDKDEQEAFEAACSVADGVAAIGGGSCSID